MTTKAKKKAPHGIAGDPYVVERRGAMFYVIAARTGVIVAGPFNERERGQRRADELNVTKVRRG